MRRRRLQCVTYHSSFTRAVTTTASTGGLWDCSMYVHGASHVPGYHTGDVIGLLVDRTNGKLVFYRNGVAVGYDTRNV